MNATNKSQMNNLKNSDFVIYDYSFPHFINQ